MSRPRTGTVRAKGPGKFEARWLNEHGKRRSKTFARKRDAQVFLRKEIGRVDDVLAGHATGAPKARTLAELAQAWVAGPGAQKRSIKTDESFLRAHLLPAFGARDIADLGPQDIERYKAERLALSDNTVNHHLTLLVSMLRHAVDLGWLTKLPKVQKYKLPEVTYSYLTTADQIRAVVDAAAECGPLARDIYPVAIFTGLRLGELAGLRGEDIDLERRIITVRRSYDGATKSGRFRTVPILDQVEPILRRRAGALPALSLVFTSSRGTMLRKDSRIFDEVLRKILRLAGLPEGYITFHDLRHTFASHWVMSGGDLFKLQRILGHASVEMTQRYAHLAPHAFAGDLDRLPNLSG